MKANMVALVPMRHTSERVPGKNYRHLGGRPLFHHVLGSLLTSDRVGRIVVDTDSPVIMGDVRRSFPDVVLLARPEHLRNGAVPMNDVIAWDISQVHADFYFQTHSTNPLLTPQTIRRAVDDFLGHYPAHDSLFSVTRLQTRLWDGMARPINHDPLVLLRTQDLPPVYEENSNLYIFSKASFETTGNRIGKRPLMFEIEKLEATDIDEEADFQLAEFLHAGLKKPLNTRPKDAHHAQSADHGSVPAAGCR